MQRSSPFVVAVFSVALSSCQSSGILQQENALAAAGFTVRIADNAERQAMLNRLPANRFVQRVHGNDVHYVYADPVVCRCLYIGTQQDFAQYVSNQQLDFAQRSALPFSIITTRPGTGMPGDRGGRWARFTDPGGNKFTHLDASCVDFTNLFSVVKYAKENEQLVIDQVHLAIDQVALTNG